MLWSNCLSLLNLPISCYWNILLRISIPVKILACGTVVVILEENRGIHLRTVIPNEGKKALTKN